jgi:hypothetical protein
VREIRRQYLIDYFLGGALLLEAVIANCWVNAYYRPNPASGLFKQEDTMMQELNRLGR